MKKICYILIATCFILFFISCERINSPNQDEKEIENSEEQSKNEIDLKIHVETPGTLNELVDPDKAQRKEYFTVKHLTITGKIICADLFYLDNRFPNLVSLDMGNTEIVEDGTGSTEKCPFPSPNGLGGKSSLEKVILPKNIGEFSFKDFKKLHTIVIPNGAELISFDAFNNCITLASINIPNSISSIGERAFYNCSALKSITIPGSVKIIAPKTFLKCTALESIKIKEGVTSIGKNAFSDCSALKSINIPNSITEISSYAFTSCTALESINFPSNITSIGEHAFSNCTALKTINIPNSITKVTSYAFANCEALESIKIGEGVKLIGLHTFSNCTSLKSIEIPNSVTQIESGAFFRCSNITHITIGSGIKDMSGAFIDCHRLAEIRIKANEPPLTGFHSSHSFSGVHLGNVKLYVPKGSKEKYQNHPQWKGFKEYIEQ